MTEFKINDNLTIECEYYENSRHWGHRGKIYRDGVQIDRKTITYYNRTWEAWTYASLLYYCSESKQLTTDEKNAIVKYIKDRG